jgi:hypothetical protein
MLTVDLYQEWGRLMSLSPSSSINSFTVEKDSGVKSGKTALELCCMSQYQ